MAGQPQRAAPGAARGTEGGGGVSAPCPACGTLPPVTPGQAAQNARVLDEEVKAWEAEHGETTIISDERNQR